MFPSPRGELILQQIMDAERPEQYRGVSIPSRGIDSTTFCISCRGKTGKSQFPSPRGELILQPRPLQPLISAGSRTDLRRSAHFRRFYLSLAVKKFLQPAIYAARRKRVVTRYSGCLLFSFRCGIDIVLSYCGIMNWPCQSFF